MKNKTKAIIIMMTILFILPISTVLANDEDLNLDPTSKDNDTYDGVVGNYKGFDFFEVNNIKVVEENSTKELTNLIEQQNTIFISKVPAKNYDSLQNNLFNTPINLINSTSNTNTTSLLSIFILAGLLITALVILFIYNYYNKKVIERINAYDYNNIIK